MRGGVSARGQTTLRAAHYRSGAVSEFLFQGPRLQSLRAIRGRSELIFGPGFFDLQCNGYAGIDFNRTSTTAAQIGEAIRAAWQHGCVSMLPTVITAAPERLEALFRNIMAALDDSEIARSVPGFHLEGPFISPEEGARGAHPLAMTRPPDRRFWIKLQRAAEGKIGLVTLAPELRGALPFIESLRAGNVLPAIGHTMAGYAVVQQAAEAGALMSTHLGNGCPQSVHRHANPIFAQLGEDRLSASIITDGVHLPAEVVRSIARAKGSGRTVLVTDAMAAAGASPGRYTLSDMELEVGADRIVRQPGSPNFAGSALVMSEAVENYSRMAGVPLAEAWDAASILPAALYRRGTDIRRIDLGTVIARRSERGLKVIATLRGRRVLWLAPHL